MDNKICELPEGYKPSENEEFMKTISANIFVEN